MKKLAKTVLYLFFSFLAIFGLYVAGVLVFSSKYVSAPRQLEKEPIVNIKDQEAISVVKEFCLRLGIACRNAPHLSDKFPIEFLSSKNSHYHRLHAIKDDSADLHGVYPCFDSTSYEHTKAVGPNAVCFSVGQSSKVVELYANRAVYNENRKMYFDAKTNDVDLTRFMSEKDAKQIIDGIGKRLALPADMIFDRLEKNALAGVWNGIWLRRKDGYRYEGDAVSVTIMGADGEFIGYTKTYRGRPCATEVKVSQSQALLSGWREFRKNLPWGREDKLKDYYAVAPELLIVNLGIPGGSLVPTNDGASKLVWAINYSFTGGLKQKLERRQRESIYDYTAEERALIEKDSAEYEKQWRRMGKPLRTFEIHIDAASGEILHGAYKPWYKRIFRIW